MPEDDPRRYGVTLGEVRESLSLVKDQGLTPSPEAWAEVERNIRREADRLAALKPERRDARWKGMARR